MGHPDSHIWQTLLPETMNIDIVPGVDHSVPFRLPRLRDDYHWEQLMAGQLTVFFAFRVVFKDAAGNRRQVDRCVFVTGPPRDTPAYDCNLKEGRQQGQRHSSN